MNIPGITGQDVGASAGPGTWARAAFSRGLLFHFTLRETTRELRARAKHGHAEALQQGRSATRCIETHSAVPPSRPAAGREAGSPPR